MLYLKKKKKALKSFIHSRYLKLKINVTFWGCFCKMHCLTCYNSCAHTLLSHSLMYQHCSWFVLLVPCVTFTVVTVIKVYRMPLVTWTIRKQKEWRMHTLASPSGEKIHLPKPFPNTRLSNLSKAHLGNKSKRESEKNMYWYFFFQMRECSFVRVYKLHVTWETSMW